MPLAPGEFLTKTGLYFERSLTIMQCVDRIGYRFSGPSTVRLSARETGGTGVTTRRFPHFEGDRLVGQGVTGPSKSNAGHPLSPPRSHSDRPFSLVVPLVPPVTPGRTGDWDRAIPTAKHSHRSLPEGWQDKLCLGLGRGPVRTILQDEDGSDCGVACAAMLAGVAYKTACQQIFKDRDPSSTSTADIRRTLSAFGVRTPARMSVLKPMSGSFLRREYWNKRLHCLALQLSF